MKTVETTFRVDGPDEPQNHWIYTWLVGESLEVPDWREMYEALWDEYQGAVLRNVVVSDDHVAVRTHVRHKPRKKGPCFRCENELAADAIVEAPIEAPAPLQSEPRVLDEPDCLGGTL